MSWQLGSLAVLGIALLAGFGLYERRAPDARMVALVGTLAALAALGRIAFAAVPNVKPTTDIVLVSGYVLGPGPGYVVGAVAALTSNFFFGQGPWTPWQMAGWGATGIFGAVLARATRGRIRRLPLALVSFAVGFLFTALQDFGDWVTYSDHSLAQLWVYVGKGLGFDLVHACGCFAFAIVFAPGAIASLRRYRLRLTVNWLPRGSGGSTLALLAGLVAASALAAGRAGAGGTGSASAATVRGSPVQYLLRAQNPDGGFGLAAGEPSSPLASGWATLALAAAGQATLRSSAGGGRGAVQYLARGAAEESGAGDLERTLLAAGAAGAADQFTAQRHTLRDLIGSDGSVSGQTNLTAFAILALRSAGARVPERSIRWLARQQDRDGGFNFLTAPGTSDVDDTAAALNALAGGAERPDGGGQRPAGVGQRILSRAVAYIRAAQNRDGGFGQEPGAPSNAQSTAFAVCGMIAAGIDPGGLHRGGAPSPIAYLRSLVQSSGAVDYSRGSSQTPVWVTAQAEVALAGRSL
jgi:energy-coupling factor transport system substrate-specific component